MQNNSKAGGALKLPPKPITEFQSASNDVIGDKLGTLPRGYPEIDAAAAAVRALQGVEFDLIDAAYAMWEAGKTSLSREAMADRLARQTATGSTSHQAGLSQVMAEYTPKKQAANAAVSLTPERVAAGDAAVKDAVQKIEAVRLERNRIRVETFSLSSPITRASNWFSPEYQAQQRLLTAKGPSAVRIEWDLAVTAANQKNWKSPTSDANPEIERMVWLATVAPTILEEWKRDVAPKQAMAARGETELTRIQNEREQVATRLLNEIEDWKQARIDELVEPYDYSYRVLVSCFQLLAGIDLHLTGGYAPRSQLDLERYIRMRPEELDLYVEEGFLLRHVAPFGTASAIGWTPAKRYRGEIVREPFTPANPLSVLKR